MSLAVELRLVVAHVARKAEDEAALGVAVDVAVDVVALEAADADEVGDGKRALGGDAHGVEAVGALDLDGAFKGMVGGAEGGDGAEGVGVVEAFAAGVDVETELAVGALERDLVVLAELRVEAELHVKVVVDEVDLPRAGRRHRALHAGEAVDVGERRGDVDRLEERADVLLSRIAVDFTDKLLHREVQGEPPFERGGFAGGEPVDADIVHAETVADGEDVRRDARRRDGEDVGAVEEQRKVGYVGDGEVDRRVALAVAGLVVAVVQVLDH